MADLIRNYKMLIKGRLSDSDDVESRPLISSASSSRSQSFGSIPAVFKQDSDTEFEIVQKQLKNQDNQQQQQQIPPVLLQKKQNRKLLYPSSYETPELDSYEPDPNEIIYQKNLPNGNNYDYNSNNNEIEQALPTKKQPTHSSLVTIFSVWNTSVGTSLLAMAWGVEKTGLFPSIIINILIAAVCLYTTYTLLKINEKHGVIGRNCEVYDLCRELLGRWAEIIAKIFSLIVLIGANIVYWILMANFLYNSVRLIYTSKMKQTTNESSVICPKNDTITLITTNTTITTTTTQNVDDYFDKYWDLYSTVPIILGIVMFPLLNWKSPTFFTKFNSLGTLSVSYIIIFVATKGIYWGVNMTDWSIEWNLKPTFFALSGMLSLSYFIHNIIISIMRNNRNQDNNGRDLTIAFALVTFTYIFLGCIFYITFPLPKYCIEDNFLNNFNQYDLMTIIARILLLFQLFTVFPLISFMLRNDVLVNYKIIRKYFNLNNNNNNNNSSNNNSDEFNYIRVIILNLIIVIICILFACFLPRIGTLIRYTGALSGLVYIFMLPSLLKIASLRKARKLTSIKLIFYISLFIIGIVNLLCQFFINDT